MMEEKNGKNAEYAVNTESKTFAAGMLKTFLFYLAFKYLQAMLLLLNIIKTGKKILSLSIDTRLRESEIANDLTKIQTKYIDVDIGSYPILKKNLELFILRSMNKELINQCNHEIEEMLKNKL